LRGDRRRQEVSARAGDGVVGEQALANVGRGDLDHDTGLDLEPAARVSHMLGKGYNLGTHYFPHDAAAQEKSGKNFEQQMREAGLENIRIVPRCREIWPGINKANELFPRCVFHKDKCASLLESLECYHTKE
jgi:hypothetical protein